MGQLLSIILRRHDRIVRTSCLAVAYCISQALPSISGSENRLGVSQGPLYQAQQYCNIAQDSAVWVSGCCRGSVTASEICLKTYSPVSTDETGCLLLFDLPSADIIASQSRQLLKEHGGISELCWLGDDIIAVGTTRGKVIVFSCRNNVVSWFSSLTKYCADAYCISHPGALFPCL